LWLALSDKHLAGCWLCPCAAAAAQGEGAMTGATVASQTMRSGAVWMMTAEGPGGRGTRTEATMTGQGQGLSQACC